MSELEVELKDGAEDALFSVGLDLVRAAPLLVASKAERGYRLSAGEEPAAHKAEAVMLDPEGRCDEAFCRLVDSLLDQLLANQPAVLAGDMMEGVHQMRVAVRRLRSLLVLFQPLLERQARRRFEDELRQLGDVLGHARDWDVFIDETLPAALHDGLALDRIEPLRAEALERRRAARQEAQKAVAAPAFARFVLALQAWSRPGGAAMTDKAAARCLANRAPALLDRLEQRLDKRLKQSDPNDPPSLHAVRKSAKKLRYGIEYFASLFGDRADGYLKRCNRLQKCLGSLNDLETATGHAAELAAASIELTPALGILANWAEQRRDRPLGKALKAERAFARIEPFWR